MTAYAVYRQEMIVGEAKVIVLDVDEDDGSGRDLTVYDDIELEVKAADGAADPALMSLTLSGGDIVLRPQSGSTLGQADMTITTAHTTTSPWPSSPGNIGRFRYDVVGIRGTERDILVPPSDFYVFPGVNTP